MKRVTSLLVPMLAASGVFAEQWRMQDEGALHFEPTWEGEVVPGRFESFDVKIDAADDGITGARIEVTVKLESADMDDPDINEAIAGAEWFAVAVHPVATFASDSVEATGEGGYLAPGHLELKGMRLPVSVPFSWSESGDRAAMKGELIIDRTRFDVGSGEWATGETIGAEVRVRFDLVLERQ